MSSSLKLVEQIARLFAFGALVQRRFTIGTVQHGALALRYADLQLAGLQEDAGDLVADDVVGQAEAAQNLSREHHSLTELLGLQADDADLVVDFVVLDREVALLQVDRRTVQANLVPVAELAEFVLHLRPQLSEVAVRSVHFSSIRFISVELFVSTLASRQASRTVRLHKCDLSGGRASGSAGTCFRLVRALQSPSLLEN